MHPDSETSVPVQFIHTQLNTQRMLRSLLSIGCNPNTGVNECTDFIIYNSKRVFLRPVINTVIRHS